MFLAETFQGRGFLVFHGFLLNFSQGSYLNPIAHLNVSREGSDDNQKAWAQIDGRSKGKKGTHANNVPSQKSWHHRAFQEHPTTQTVYL